MHDTELSGFLLVWTIFLGCTGLVTALTHRYLTSTIGANSLAAFIAVIGLALADTIHLGYFDGWLIITAPIAGSIAFGVGALVGMLLDRLGISRRARGATHGV